MLLPNLVLQRFSVKKTSEENKFHLTRRFKLCKKNTWNFYFVEEKSIQERFSKIDTKKTVKNVLIENLQNIIIKNKEIQSNWVIII